MGLHRPRPAGNLRGRGRVAIRLKRTFRVAIPSQLRSYTAGAARVTVAVDADPPRLADVFAGLEAAYPGIRFRMVDEAGRVSTMRFT